MGLDTFNKRSRPSLFRELSAECEFDLLVIRRRPYRGVNIPTWSAARDSRRAGGSERLRVGNQQSQLQTDSWRIALHQEPGVQTRMGILPRAQSSHSAKQATRAAAAISGAALPKSWRRALADAPGNDSLRSTLWL